MTITMNRMPWSEEDDKTLANLCGRMSSSEIGRLLGRSASAVRRRCSTIGVSRMQDDRRSQIWSDEEVQRMLYLRSKGYSNRQIAIDLNRAIESVQGKLYNMRKFQNKKTEPSDSETLWGSVSLMGLRVPLNELAEILR